MATASKGGSFWPVLILLFVVGWFFFRKKDKVSPPVVRAPEDAAVPTPVPDPGPEIEVPGLVVPEYSSPDRFAEGPGVLPALKPTRDPSDYYIA